MSLLHWPIQVYTEKWTKAEIILCMVGQWETALALLCNVVSHWPSSYTEWSTKGLIFAWGTLIMDNIQEKNPNQNVIYKLENSQYNFGPLDGEALKMYIVLRIWHRTSSFVVQILSIFIKLVGHVSATQHKSVGGVREISILWWPRRATGVSRVHELWPWMSTNSKHKPISPLVPHLCVVELGQHWFR